MFKRLWCWIVCKIKGHKLIKTGDEVTKTMNYATGVETRSVHYVYKCTRCGSIL